MRLGYPVICSILRSALMKPYKNIFLSSKKVEFKPSHLAVNLLTHFLCTVMELYKYLYTLTSYDKANICIYKHLTKNCIPSCHPHSDHVLKDIQYIEY